MALQRRWAAEDLGERLQQRRAELGLTQEQLAEKLVGVTLRALQRWEAGEVVPQDRNLYKLADALGMDPEEFIVRPAEVSGRNKGQLDRIEQKVDHLLRLVSQQQVSALADEVGRGKATKRRSRPRKRGAGGAR